MVVNNPNNWHWVDKNCIDWAKQYFNENLIGLRANGDDGTYVAVDSVSSIEGDVEVCQRKGKVISLFDLRIILNISGVAIVEPEKTFKGSITVPELAYDTEEDEIQFDVSVYNEDEDLEKMRALAKKELLPSIRLKLLKFGCDLITTHSKDIQLESDKVNSVFTKENQSQSSLKAPAQPEKKAASAKSQTPSSVASSSTSESNSVGNGVPKYNTSTLHLEPTFNTTAEQLYITLLDRERIGAWTRSAPSLEAFPPKEGSEFKLFGGSISGKFVNLVPNERITQLWRLEDWNLVKDSVVCGALELIVVDGEGGRIRWVEDVGFPRHGRVAPGGALLPNWLVQIQAQTLEKRRGEIGRRECTFTFHCDSVVVMSFEKYFLKSGTKEIAKKRLRMERISNVGKLIT